MSPGEGSAHSWLSPRKETTSPVHPPCKSHVHGPIGQPRGSSRLKELQQPQRAQQPARVPEKINPHRQSPRLQIQDQVPAPDPMVTPNKEAIQEPVGRLTCSQSQLSEQPISRRTRSKLNQALSVTPEQAAQIKFPRELLALWFMPETSLDHIDMPVLDPDNGDTMEYRQLRRHPNYRYIWETLYCNDLGHLCQ